MLETPFPNVPMYDGDEDLLVLGSRESTDSGGAIIAEMLLSMSSRAKANAATLLRSTMVLRGGSERILIPTWCQQVG